MYKEIELEMDSPISRIYLQNASSCKYHFSIKVCASSRHLSSSSDAWVKYNEKVLDVSDSNQNVETTSNSKLKLTELILQKCAGKTSKDDL